MAGIMCAGIGSLMKLAADACITGYRINDNPD